MDECSDIPRCKICGDTVPPGKELCWCCEHGSKLHVDHEEDECSDHDSCEINFTK